MVVVPGLAAQRDDVFVGFEDPVDNQLSRMCRILHRVQLGRSWRIAPGHDVVGDRQLGRQVPTGLIDDQMGAGIDGGIWMRCAAMSVGRRTEGHDQPGALVPFAGQIAPKI